MRFHMLIGPDLGLTLYRSPRDGIPAALAIAQDAIYNPPEDRDYLRVLMWVAAVLEHTGPGGATHGD